LTDDKNDNARADLPSVETDGKTRQKSASSRLLDH
jgi:hypothetical protein